MAIHKRRLLEGGGGAGQKCPNLPSKKTTKREKGGHKIGKMGPHRLLMAPNGPLKYVLKPNKDISETKRTKEL